MPYDQSTLGTLLYGISGVGRPIRHTQKGGTGLLLGGGIRGLAPMPIVVENNSSDFEMTRVTLREVWNNTPLLLSLTKDTGSYACTPFRKKMNAGDILSRVNYSCGGSCQTPQSIPGIYSLRSRIGAIQDKCDRSLNPPSACNVKYVYDSSDYTTFLKNQAVNRNYNDLSYGGDQSNASFTTIQKMRHF